MLNSYLQALIREKIISLNTLPNSKLPFPVEGIVRVIDSKGRTVALLLSRKVLEEMEEDLESLNPEFIDSLEKSRKTGKVTSRKIEKKLGL